ncbi:hypothetical protein [Deinococcus hopiensis]|uniref:Uncharacterized protein n=1 Tax=Deinococcus hopiensis KR-140 TaxID=695939 RepID=A0A1W1UFY2_9DEIO|nr:hypothetical protein [Deinococcus hopiensis]SMB79694.1 hypothetical protein SAMN00790413_05306 [Deinococcus hopiensis KR-140]
MRPGTVYTLERGEALLGRLTVVESGMFAIRCTFGAAPAFAPYRPLFEEDAFLAERMAGDDDSALLEEAEAVLERLLALGLVLRREGGGVYRGALISIEGNQASFRPLDPEEQPL